jgi:hypothetical protein
VSEPKSPGDERDALDERIAAALRPRPVPPAGDDDLDELVLRVLDGNADAEETRRVLASPLATEKLAILRESMASASAPLVSAARYVFAVARGALEFLRGATAPVVAPNLAWAVRSGGPAQPEPFCEFHHPFQSVDAHVRVEQVSRPDATPAIDLEVRLSEAGAPLTQARVTLRREGQTLDSIPTDAAGSALFTGLAVERYELELRRSGGVVGVMVLEFLPE